MDFDRQTISLPEPKRMKAKYLLAEPALQRGNRDVPVRLLQEVTGCAQYWSMVCPEMAPKLPALYRGAETKATPSALLNDQGLRWGKVTGKTSGKPWILSASNWNGLLAPASGPPSRSVFLSAKDCHARRFFSITGRRRDPRKVWEHRLEVQKVRC